MPQPDRIWSASWIENTSCPPGTAPFFTKTFTLDKPFAAASLYICGLGFYVARINGRRVGDELLNPAFTYYDQRVYYNVLNAAPYLVQGENVIEVTLGNGWFNQQEPDAWRFEQAEWRARPQLICELIVDGELTLVSDSSWLCGTSRTVFNSLRCGETYAAALVPSDLHPAKISRGPGGALQLQTIQPIRLQEVLEPVAVIPASRTDAIYDFGVNLTGNVEICVRGQRGGKVTIYYSERANADDGTINRVNISEHVHCKRFQQDEYILSGEGEETWHSEFGYNGFRYTLIYCENAELLSVKARCFHTDLPSAGSFVIDHPLITQLQSAILRCTRTNFHHMPTDCPQREKNGWTGDAALSCEQSLFNFDMHDGYVKWLNDIIDGQRPSGEIPCIVPGTRWGYNGCNGPTWDIALFELPWQTYLFTGDKDILRQCVNAMKRYLSHLRFTSDNGVWRIGLGDWCPPSKRNISTEVLLTAYAWRAYDLYAKVCDALELSEEAADARINADKVRVSFQKAFIGKEPDTQTYLSLLLAFNLSDEPKEELVARLENTIERYSHHMECGIFGVKLMYNALTDNGRFDLAWKLLNAEGYPGWSDMLEKCPSTLSENWRTSSSRNHHMYSSIGDWFYKGIAGIHPDEKQPGFKHIFLRPHIPEGCGFFHAEHRTPFGLMSIEWKNSHLTIVLPENTSATLTWNESQLNLSAGQHTL